MVDLTATVSYRVVPERWDELDDLTIVNAYEDFKMWVLEYEEMMTFKEADNAFKMLEQWEQYLEARGLAQ